MNLGEYQRLVLTKIFLDTFKSEEPRVIKTIIQPINNELLEQTVDYFGFKELPLGVLIKNYYIGDEQLQLWLVNSNDNWSESDAIINLDYGKLVDYENRELSNNGLSDLIKNYYQGALIGLVIGDGRKKETKSLKNDLWNVDGMQYVNSVSKVSNLEKELEIAILASIT